MGFASLSEVIPAPGSAVIGSALPLRRRLAPRPWGLPDHRRVRSFENGRSASPRVGPPTEYDRVSCRCPVGQRRLPWSFSPLQRIRMREPTNPGFASSRCWCGYRVSRPPAAFLLPRPSDRLGPVTLMGFPLRSFPLPRSRDASRRPLPSCRWPSRRAAWHQVPHPSPDRPDFRALLPAEVRGEKAGVSRPFARCSPGVFRALGRDRRCVADGFPSAPPTDFTKSAMWRLCRSPGVSIRNGAWRPEGCHNPSALSAPRLPSARFGSRRSELTPTNPVTSLFRDPSEERPRALPEGTRSEWRCQVPGRRPTFEGSIRGPRSMCQTIAGKGVTWPGGNPCNCFRWRALSASPEARWDENPSKRLPG